MPVDIVALRDHLATLHFLHDNSSFRMGPAYRAEISKLEEQIAKLSTVTPATLPNRAA